MSREFTGATFSRVPTRQPMKKCEKVKKLQSAWHKKKMFDRSPPGIKIEQTLLKLFLDAETINKSNERVVKREKMTKGRRKVCQRQPQSKRKFRTSTRLRFSNDSHESWEEEEMEINNYQLKAQSKCPLWSSSPADAVEFRVQISRLQIGALASILRCV